MREGDLLIFEIVDDVRGAQEGVTQESDVACAGADGEDTRRCAGSVAVDGAICEGHGGLDEVGDGDVDFGTVGARAEVEGEDGGGGGDVAGDDGELFLGDPFCAEIGEDGFDDG